MRIMVIGADCSLGAALVVGLEQNFEVAAIGSGIESDIEGYRQVDLLAPEEMDAVLEGIDVVVCGTLFAAEMTSEQELIDFVARSTYVALGAACAAGVGRAVLLSNLDLLRDYPEDYVVNPQWNALPQAEAAALAPMLVELTGREIARKGELDVRCLRLGAIGEETSSEDAVAAVQAALSAEALGHHWSLSHVASKGRFAGVV